MTFEIDETLLVPFKGDGRFFHLTAAAGFKAHPRGEVEGQQLSLEIVTASTDEGDVVAQVSEHLDRVETLLSHQSDEVERWREAFGRAAVRAVADRKTRVALAERTLSALKAAGYRHVGDAAG